MNARCYLLLAALLATGCNSGDAEADNGSSLSSSPPEGSLIERVESVAGQPTTVITTDGQRIVLKRGEAIVGDTMVLESASGHIEYHRTPSAIMAERSQVEVAYLVEDSDELVYFKGLQGNPLVDPASGKLCWMAVTCKNTACTSDGAFFSFREEGFSIDAGGNVVHPDPRDSRRPTTTRPCPTCANGNFLEPYRPAEVAQRRAQLEAELEAARKARATVNDSR